MISREEVVWLYRCFLGRDPESEDAIQTHIAIQDWDNARLAFVNSAEFAFWQRSLNRDGVLFRPKRQTPTFTKGDKKLALVCIVKDESLNVERMLKSCLPIVDFVSLVDTGSSDDTVKIAREMLTLARKPYKIREVKFEGFSHARNISLEGLPASIDWSLAIDADEHLVADDYQRLLDLLEGDEIDGWQLPRFNFVDRDKLLPAKPYPDFQKRLLRHRVDDAICFQGAVHESVENVRRWGFAPASEAGTDGIVGGPHIHHMGQVDLSLERWQEKHDFYTRLNGGRAS